jgi:hypothetical protein
VSVPGQQFPFVPRTPARGAVSLAPMLPLTLVTTRSVPLSGLLDTGASLSVLPYRSGIELGFTWSKQTVALELGGNLAIIEARAIAVSAIVGGFAPVRLAFAWARSDDVPVILGQINFFAEFDVCFFRSRGVFEVRPAQRP